MRESEGEGCALARYGFHPEMASVAFDNFLADCQANAGAGVFVPGVQPLEDDENPLEVLRPYADAVVLHRELPMDNVSVHGNVDFRCLETAELDCVADEVLEQLRQLSSVCFHHRKLIVTDDRSRFVDGRF